MSVAVPPSRFTGLVSKAFQHSGIRSLEFT